MDSLLYVMIPSLLSFFALFWAFYALHSYTVDTKVVSQLYQRMKESRNSIRQKFTNSGPGSIRVRRTSDTDFETLCPPNALCCQPLLVSLILSRNKSNQPVDRSPNRMKILTARNKRISIHQMYHVTNMQFDFRLFISEIQFFIVCIYLNRGFGVRTSDQHERGPSSQRIPGIMCFLLFRSL